MVERRAGPGWETVAETATDAAGAFSATFEPRAGGRVRARIADAGAISSEVRLSVLPSIAVRRSGGRAFLGAPLRVQIRPVTYRGRVTVFSLRGGPRGRARERTCPGRTPARGRAHARDRELSRETGFPAAFGLEPRIVKSRVRATARRLSVGSHGPDVRALHRRLAELRVHVPGLSRRYSWATFDAVLAFQKAVGLSRTGVVSAATWRALGRRRGFGPRYGKPKLHIEVGKTRQILMVVRRGRVTAVLPVSTGATGNTPEGAFRIPLEGAGDEHLAGARDPLSHDDLSRELRHPRLGRRTALPGEPRVRARSHLGRRLALRPLAGRRARVRLRLSSRAGIKVGGG
ncbi:MAG: L,D-transpeptidase family protein [Gaiellaceae bacterium]